MRKIPRLIATALLATLTAGFAWLSWTSSQLPYIEQGSESRWLALF